MPEKLNYEQMEQRLKELEKEVIESKREEHALRENEERYREIASNIPGVVYQFVTVHRV